MGAATQIAVEEYLRTSYRPDREYVDGQVRERNLGEKSHSRLQFHLALYFHLRSVALNLKPFSEWRVQVSKSRYRVPDVCVVRGSDPESEILHTPPYIVIEVLSPSDTWSEMAERFADYESFGVPNIWVVDPVKRRAWRVIGGEREESFDLLLTTTDGEVTVPLLEVFAEIDAIK